jgi:hypothetical protein
MTAPTNENQAQVAQTSEKELNFRKLEAKYQQELAYERGKREEAEKRAQEISQRQQQIVEEPEDEFEAIDHKKLEKKLNKFGQQYKQETQTEIQKAVKHAIREERKESWIRSNPDFEEVLMHAEKLALKAPDLADSILEMPESFERQKLVYKNIKALGLHKPEDRQPSIQEKIDANRKGPYYQPASVGTAPYHSASDFSAGGQKQAYDKMKELQSRLRL